MEDLYGIQTRRQAVEENIEKAFGSGVNLNEEVEKARSGIYADTAENRKLNRVGQEYGYKKMSEKEREELEKKKIYSARKKFEEKFGKNFGKKKVDSKSDVNEYKGLKKNSGLDIKNMSGWGANAIKSGADYYYGKIMDRDVVIVKQHNSDGSEEYSVCHIDGNVIAWNGIRGNELEKVYNSAERNIKEYKEYLENREKEEKVKKEISKVSSDIDSLGYYLGDNPDEDESGNTRDWSMKEIIDEMLDNKDIVSGVKKLIEKHGVNETYKKLGESSDAFNAHEIKRIVLAINKKSE